MSHRHSFTPPLIHSKSMPLQARLLRRRFQVWHQPVSHMHNWKLLPGRQRQPFRELPRQLHIQHGLRRHIRLLLQAGIRAVLRTMPPLPGRVLLHERRSQLVPLQQLLSDRIQRCNQLRLHAWILRTQRRSLRPVSSQQILHWRHFHY